MPKILLIEDDLLLLRMYQEAFKNAGVDILHAIDGEEGQKKAVDEKPDLILLDLVLPKKNGFEVLKEVKSNKATSRIPVICLTVLHQEEDIKKCKDQGVLEYFVKTDISPDQVVAKVLSLVSGS